MGQDSNWRILQILTANRCTSQMRQPYATLGAIGFEARWDYVCIGSVTKLAARLCSEVKGGQILANQKTLARIEDAVEVALKGIAQTVPVFSVTTFKS